MPAPQPDLDVAAVIAAGLGGSWAVGTNIFGGPDRPQTTGGDRTPNTQMPANAIFVLAYSGGAPAPYLGVNAGSVYPIRIQVRVRGRSADFTASVALARSVRDVLHRATISGYFLCLARDAEPTYLEEDGAGNESFSINFDLMRTGTP